MKYFTARNVTRHVDLGRKIRSASSLVDRAVGLLTTASLPAGEGLWIHPCTSIHTFFMRYPIDAIFIDADGKVMALETLAPWKLSHWHRQSAGVLELSAGTIAQSKTQAGDLLEIKAVL